MQIKQQVISPTKIKLTVSADQKAIDSIKKSVLNRLSADVKLPGFRNGKAPLSLIEKQVDQAVYQNEFLNEAVNQLFSQAVKHEKLKVVDQAEVSITKFVPFSALEFSVEAEVLGEVKLADYKNIKLLPKKVEVSAEDVAKVVDDLRGRAAKRTDVKRAAKLGDEVVIDFKGVDAKTKEPINGASGKAYPLILGSNTFIPGFEDQLIGLSPKGTKSFNITFPSDYAAGLKNKLVKFEVSLLSVTELVSPKADDKFASTIGPFKSLSELKTDIKKQVKIERQKEADQLYNDELLKTIADKSDVAIPPRLIEEDVDKMEEEEKRNIVYRGETWQEHLSSEGISEEEHRARQRPQAEARVKTGVILGEISEREKISITPQELETRLTLLKNQYSDETMRSELDKPENKLNIHNRLLIEKTIEKLRSYSLKAPLKS